jgi:gamma-glutamyltranspeptidase/glutathione hydrolase
MAAAECPGVLGGPLQMLVAGAGAGVMAIDGRVRQPGLGVPRPRGFKEDEGVPDAARVGVPMAFATLAVALATHGKTSLSRVTGQAIPAARARSAARARLLDRFVRLGARVVGDDWVASELIAAAGRAAGGLLTKNDLEAVRPSVVRRDDSTIEPSGIVRVPWSRPAEPVAPVTQVVAATDAWGLAAVASYESTREGLDVGELGIVLPLLAEPVRRWTRGTWPHSGPPSSSVLSVRTDACLVALTRSKNIVRVVSA